MQYIFVSGCARSGTSTTADLIRAHPDVAFGRERYNSLFKRDHTSFDQSLFEQHRFCNDLKSDDTHHKVLGPYYRDVRRRWITCTHVGDKIPSLHRQYAYLFETFPDCRMIFLLRNIIDVAQSFETRRLRSLRSKDPWPADWGVRRAVSEWNESLSNTWTAIEATRNILVVPFESLYSDEDLLKRICDFLQLNIHPQVSKMWNKKARQKRKLEIKRRITLKSSEKQFLCQSANFTLYRRLLEKTTSL